MTDKELVRRALLGDQEAQKKCTEKGIVLPCWRCGGESEIQELHTGGKPIYAVTCKKTYCGAYGCAHSTQQKAIEYWNIRPASLTHKERSGRSDKTDGTERFPWHWSEKE